MGLCSLVLKESMARMPDTTFDSSDNKYGLVVNMGCLKKVLKFCLRANGVETGGILNGYYAEGHDKAIVCSISGPPVDSKSGSTWFIRGIRGLQERIDKLWSKGHFYLGEWHFHPGGRAYPSPTDIKSMQKVAHDPQYHCPEPIMIIVGGSSEKWEIRAYVFPRQRPMVELIRP